MDVTISYRDSTGGIRLCAVTVSDYCRVCCGPRGQPQVLQSREDGRYYSCEVWNNPCGHIDYFDALIREAALLKAAAAFGSC